MYIFLTSDGGAQWSQQQKLAASDGAAFDYFGSSLSLGGGVLAVAALLADAAGADSGA